MTLARPDSFILDMVFTCCGSCEGAGPGQLVAHPANLPGHCVCGVPNNWARTKIVGGAETEIGEYPWQVSS